MNSIMDSIVFLSASSNLFFSLKLINNSFNEYLIKIIIYSDSDSGSNSSEGAFNSLIA